MDIRFVVVEVVIVVVVIYRMEGNVIILDDDFCCRYREINSQVRVFRKSTLTFTYLCIDRATVDKQRCTEWVVLMIIVKEFKFPQDDFKIFRIYPDAILTVLES